MRKTPGALLEISQFFHTLAVRPFIIHYYFLTVEDDYNKDRFPVIQVHQLLLYATLNTTAHLTDRSGPLTDLLD
jgi:hypothetical protein